MSRLSSRALHLYRACHSSLLGNGPKGARRRKNVTVDCFIIAQLKASHPDMSTDAETVRHSWLLVESARGVGEESSAGNAVEVPRAPWHDDL